MKIFFFHTPPTLRNRILLKSFITKQFKIAKIERSALNIIFCSDDELLQINREFLQHDYLTDIITFDYGLDEAVELYISTERVRENARIEGVSFSNEILRVIFHGTLHVFGYGDKTSEEIGVIRTMESDWITQFKIYVSRETL